MMSEHKDTVTKQTVAGVLLAAGRGKRFGLPKALIEWQDRYLVEILAERLSKMGFIPLVIVINPDVERVLRNRKDVYANLETICSVVTNPEPEKGTLQSIRLALKELKTHVEAALLFPVDHPFVTPATVTLLCKNASRDSIMIPTFHGRRGHPPLFGSDYFQLLFDIPLEEGARSAYRQAGTVIREIEVEDENILLNVNNPVEWEKGLKRSGWQP